ncbi:hypothetical protein CHUAL_003873 [Chamberlinius hualienensis]
MALKGCPVCLKWLVLTFNLIYWLIGIGILSIAVYFRINYSQYTTGIPMLEKYYTGIYIIMGTGVLIAVIGFFGCVGAYKESPCMLGTFFTLLFVVFAAEVGAGVWAFLRKGDLDSLIEDALQYTIKNYGSEALQTEALDAIQRQVKCCGVKGPFDWKDSKYGRESTPDIGVASKVGFYRVPKSCCNAPENSPACSEMVRAQHTLGAIFSNIHTEGCKKAVQQFANEMLDYVAGIGIGIAIIELLGMILSMILCCAIRHDNDYKH